MSKDTNKFNQNLCTMYALYIMLIYVLVCPTGYTNYEMYKQMFLLAISVLLLLYIVPRFALSLRNIKSISLDKYACTLFITWSISFLMSTNKFTAFYGDESRFMGYAFMLICLLSLCLCRKYAVWNNLLYIAFLIMCAVVWSLQILQYNRIDPFNWQQNFTITYRASTLGNINQNAYFDGIVLATLIGLFIAYRNIWQRITAALAIFIGTIAATETRSETIIIALATVVLVLVAYVIFHLEYLKDTLIIAWIMYAAILVRRITWSVNGLQEIWGEILLEKLLFSTYFLIAMFILLLALTIILIAFRGSKPSRRIQSRIFAVYCLAILAAVASGLVYMYGNTLSGANPSLSFTGDFGSGRGRIWQWVIDAFSKSTPVRKLFGSSLGQFVEAVYAYEADLINLSYPRNTLADAHNVWLDLLITTGLVGVIAYTAFFISLIKESLRVAKTNPLALVSLLVIAAYIGGGMNNGNLMVTTPVAYLLVGTFLSSCEASPAMRSVPLS